MTNPRNSRRAAVASSEPANAGLRSGDPLGRAGFEWEENDPLRGPTALHHPAATGSRDRRSAGDFDASFRLISLRTLLALPLGNPRGDDETQYRSTAWSREHSASEPQLDTTRMAAKYPRDRCRNRVRDFPLWPRALALCIDSSPFLAAGLAGSLRRPPQPAPRKDRADADHTDHRSAVGNASRGNPRTVLDGSIRQSTVGLHRKLEFPNHGSDPQRERPI